jgi:cell division protein FtsB
MDLRLKLKIVRASDRRARLFAKCKARLQEKIEGLAERARPSFQFLYQIRRKVATSVVATLTVWLFAHVMFGANGMVIYRQKKDEFQSLQKEIDGLQKDNQTYNAAIKALKSDPKTIEQEAREQLHYVRPGEVVYVTPAPAPPPRQDVDAAQK